MPDKRTAIEAPTRGHVLRTAAFGVLTGVAAGIILLDSDGGWSLLWQLPLAGVFALACVVFLCDAVAGLADRRTARGEVE